MRNLVKYVGIGLLVMGLAACDDKDTNATAQGSVAESNAGWRGVHCFRTRFPRYRRSSMANKANLHLRRKCRYGST